jgi:hypothetical protein
MKPVEIVEIFIPWRPGDDPVGWVRTRGRWGGVSTWMADSRILAGIAREVLANPETPAACSPQYLQRSREYATSWPPKEAAQMWVVREDTGGGEAVWVRRTAA